MWTVLLASLIVYNFDYDIIRPHYKIVINACNQTPVVGSDDMNGDGRNISCAAGQEALKILRVVELDGDVEQDDEISIKRDAVSLVELIGRDWIGLDTAGPSNAAGECRGTAQRCTQDLLERLGRVALSAKYEFDEMQRRKRLESALEALSRVVELVKLKKSWSCSTCSDERFLTFESLELNESINSRQLAEDDHQYVYDTYQRK